MFKLSLNDRSQDWRMSLSIQICNIWLTSWCEGCCCCWWWWCRRQPNWTEFLPNKMSQKPGTNDDDLNKSKLRPHSGKWPGWIVLHLDKNNFLTVKRNALEMLFSCWGRIPFALPSCLDKRSDNESGNVEDWSKRLFFPHNNASLCELQFVALFESLIFDWKTISLSGIWTRASYNCVTNVNNILSKLFMLFWHVKKGWC